jgi:guanylate kinase
MKGCLFIITAPSGAGKTSLVHELLSSDRRLHLSISYTTRQPRPGEENGKDYHFVSTETFSKMQKAGDFLESALVHGNYYGTSRNWLLTQIQDGKDIILEIDWQGAKQVRSAFPEAIGIFILPPSVRILEERLTNRGQDAQSVIKTRLEAARAEMSHLEEFDYVIINDVFEKALKDLASIVLAQRLKVEYQLEHQSDLIKSLTK